MSGCIECIFDKEKNCFRYDDHNLFITKLAINMILKNRSNEQMLLRVFLSAGGCAGFKSNFKFWSYEEKKDLDYIFCDENKKPIIIIDEKSLSYIDGSTLDYQNSIERTGFILIPKKGVNSCGCGFSFGG